MASRSLSQHVNLFPLHTSCWYRYASYVYAAYVHSGHWGQIRPGKCLVYSLIRSNIPDIFQIRKPPKNKIQSRLDYSWNIPNKSKRYPANQPISSLRSMDYQPEYSNTFRIFSDQYYISILNTKTVMDIHEKFDLIRS